jgi:hypothetical protein
MSVSPLEKRQNRALPPPLGKERGAADTRKPRDAQKNYAATVVPR